MEEIAKSKKNEWNERTIERMNVRREWAKKCVDLNSGQLRSMHLIFLQHFTSSLRSNNSVRMIWTHIYTLARIHTTRAFAGFKRSTVYKRRDWRRGCVWLCSIQTHGRFAFVHTAYTMIMHVMQSRALAHVPKISRAKQRWLNHNFGRNGFSRKFLPRIFWEK